jgi:hyperosmotically inducible periplasmic protein
MRFHTVKAVFAILVLMLAGLVATAGANTKPRTLSEQVHHKLVMLPWYGVFDNLQYQINGSEVVLSGQVASEHSQTKYDFEKAVKGIEGVTKVVNNIEALPPSPFDDQTRHAEYRAIFSRFGLARYTLGPIPEIHIIVDGGHVTLEGSVMSQMDRQLAGMAANGVPGVFSVTNNLHVG